MLSKSIISDLKNLLGNPINSITYRISKGEEKGPEIYNISEDNLVKFFKFLFSISNEFMLSFMSTFPQNKSLNKEKIKGSTLLNILQGLISTKNSYYIARDYRVLFDNYLLCFNQKGITENTKYRMFQSLIKYLYKNDFNNIKNLEATEQVYEVLLKYFDHLKVEENVQNSLEFIKEKYLKDKEIPIKVLELTQTFLDNKLLLNHQLIVVDFNCELLQKKFLKTISIYDYFIEDSLTYINSFSFLFTNLLKFLDGKSKNEEQVKNRIISHFFRFFYLDSKINEITKFTRNFISFSLLTNSNYEANTSLIKFLKESIDISNSICEIDFSQITEGKLNDEYKSIIENLRKKCENLNIMTEIYGIMTEPNKRNILYEKLIEIISPEERHLISTEERYLISPEERYLIERSLIMFIPPSEIENLIEIGNSLISQYEDTSKRTHLLNFLSTEVILLFFFIKLLANSFKWLNDTESLKIKKTFIFKILNFLKKLLNYKLFDNNLMDIIMLILKENMLINDEEIKEEINSIILNEIMELIFCHKGIQLKNIVKLYLHYREKYPDQEILPFFFDKYFFNESKNLYCLKFCNEILKNQKGINEFKEIIFQEKYTLFVLNEMMKNSQDKILDLVESYKCGKEEKDNNELEYYINHEIECLTYEMYYILYENQSEFEKFQKKLFKILFNLSSKSGVSDEMINNLKLCKIFNLIVYQIKFLPLKSSRQIKLMNIALYENIEVRRHILSKINTYFNKLNRKSFFFFNHISVLTIPFVCLGDPDKVIVKTATEVISKFFEICRIKFHLTEIKLKENNEDVPVQINSNLARYIPENYIGVFIMFYVFNFNLNMYFVQKDKKNFEKIFKSFLKILSKDKAEYDSELLTKNIISIRKINLTSRKKFSKVPMETHFKEEINYNQANGDIHKVKNEVCDMMIKLIRETFSKSERKYESKEYINLDVQLYCPSIFLNNDNNNNLFKSNLGEKTDIKIKDSDQNVNDPVKRQLFVSDENKPVSTNINDNLIKTESKKEEINEENSQKNKENETNPTNDKLKRKSRETNKKKKKTKK